MAKSEEYSAVVNIIVGGAGEERLSSFAHCVVIMQPIFEDFFVDLKLGFTPSAFSLPTFSLLELNCSSIPPRCYVDMT